MKDLDFGERWAYILCWAFMIAVALSFVSCSSPDKPPRDSISLGQIKQKVKEKKVEIKHNKAAPKEEGFYHVKGCSPDNPKFSKRLKSGRYRSIDFSFKYRLTKHSPGGRKKRSLVWLTLNGRHIDLLAKVMLTDLGARQTITIRHGIGQIHGNKAKYSHSVVMPPGLYDFTLKFLLAEKRFLVKIIDEKGGVVLWEEHSSDAVVELKRDGRLVWDHGHATGGVLGPHEICVNGTAWSRPVIKTTLVNFLEVK